MTEKEGEGPSLRVGTVGFPIAKHKVLAEVDVIELAEIVHFPPKAKVARRIKSDAPPRVCFTVQLPRFLVAVPPGDAPLPGNLASYGAFRLTEENLGLWDKAMCFADEIDAQALVLVTPLDFTPTKPNREVLSAFLAAVDPHNRPIVWEPHGPWEHDIASSFANDAGLVLAVDPLRDAPPQGRMAYFRLGPFAAMGSRLGVYDLERLAGAAESFELAFCVFDTPRALDDARNLRTLLNQGGSSVLQALP